MTPQAKTAKPAQQTYKNEIAPAFWRQFIRSYTSAACSAFIFHGNTGDHVMPGIHLGSFLSQSLAARDIIVFYDRAQGFRFPLPAMEDKARTLLGLNEAPAQPAPNAALAALMGNSNAQSQQKPPFPTDPAQALPLVGKLLYATTVKVAVIINHVETILPQADMSMMPPGERSMLVQLLEWGRADNQPPNPLILVCRNLVDLNEAIRAATSGYKAIELPIPTYTQRLNFINFFLSSQTVNFEGMTREDLASQTAGLTLVHIENILLEADTDGKLDAASARRMKDEMIRTEYAGLVEIMNPSYGFEQVGGMERIKAWARVEIIEPVKEGRYQDAPKGVILVGPPGSGKTYFIQALASEIGFNAVAVSMDKILGGIVGESEKRMARVLGLVKALSPVLVFMDELDQSDVSRRGNDSGNPVASNLFNQMLQFLGDESNRGRVIFFAASNRPDLIDSAMLRFGRTDAIIPVLLPNAEERLAIVAAQAKTQNVQISEQAAAMIAGQTKDYSAADLSAVVAKARKVQRQIDSGPIHLDATARAMASIRPGTLQTASYYTLLAVQAVNDRELLPPEYAGLLEDRSALEAKIEQEAPAATTRTKREL